MDLTTSITRPSPSFDGLSDKLIMIIATFLTFDDLLRLVEASDRVAQIFWDNVSVKLSGKLSLNNLGLGRETFVVEVDKNSRENSKKEKRMRRKNENVLKCWMTRDINLETVVKKIEQLGRVYRPGSITLILDMENVAEQLCHRLLNLEILKTVKCVELKSALSEEVARLLANLPQLKTLNVKGSVENWNVLKGLKSLKKVEFWKAPSVTPDVIAQIDIETTVYRMTRLRVADMAVLMERIKSAGMKRKLTLTIEVRKCTAKNAFRPTNPTVVFPISKTTYFMTCNENTVAMKVYDDDEHYIFEFQMMEAVHNMISDFLMTINLHSEFQGLSRAERGRNRIICSRLKKVTNDLNEMLEKEDGHRFGGQIVITKY